MSCDQKPLPFIRPIGPVPSHGRVSSTVVSWANANPIPPRAIAITASIPRVVRFLLFISSPRIASAWCI